MADQIPWPYPADGALTYIRDHAIPTMEAGTAWHWSIRPIEALDQLVGIISLMVEPDNNRGFWLIPEWWGRGLANETAAVATQYWFETLELPVLRVWRAVANTPSVRISERAGMRIVASEDRTYVSGGFHKRRHGSQSMSPSFSYVCLDPRKIGRSPRRGRRAGNKLKLVGP